MLGTTLLVSALTVAQPAFVAGETKKTPMGGMAEDSFGSAVAIDGDTAVIGAQSVDRGVHTDAGMAFVYERSGGTWTHTATLTASNPNMSDYFGYSVAIDGDTIVVGAPNAGGGDTGVAYLFEKPGGGWADTIETARLRASDGAAGYNLGFSVAIHENIVVAGAATDGASQNGAAYLFEKPDGGWSNMLETAKLTASDAVPEGRLGFWVAVHLDTVVVGSPNCDNTGPGVYDGPGGLYIYERPPAGWVNTQEIAKLTAGDADESDYLGYGISFDGQTIVAGAVNDGNSGAGTDDGTGSAYVFERPEGGWVDATHNARLIYSNPEGMAYFGFSVGMSNGKIVIGTPNQSHTTGNADGQGAAYLFVRPDDGWAGTILEDEELLASDAADNRLFGYKVAISDDWIVVGAPSPGPGMTEAGGAYFFSLDDDEDGVANHADNCPLDPAKLDPGACGCGVEELDSDGDGILDCNDACPDDPSNDSDGDGVCNSVDACPGGDDHADVDADGIPDDCDANPMVAAVPDAEQCCGGGMPALLPFMLMGFRRRRCTTRRNRNRTE